MQTNRRSFMAAIPTAALVIGAPALSYSAGSDAEIEASWVRKVEAVNAYNLIALNGDTPEEKALENAWAREDEFIMAAVAKTPRGNAVKLWLVLEGTVQSLADHTAVLKRDLAHFDGEESHLDFSERVILSALRSLRQQEA